MREEDTEDLASSEPASGAAGGPTPPPDAEGSVGHPVEGLGAASQEELRDRLLRLRAEFDNFRKRVSREREGQREQLAADLLREILPVLDALDTAASMPVPEAAESYQQGVAQIRNQLWAVLHAAGLEEVPGAGEPFDPQVHEAVGLVETEAVEPGVVAEVAQKGYLLGKELLRAARVRVATSD